MATYNQSTSLLNVEDATRGNCIISGRTWGSAGAYTPFGGLKDVSLTKDMVMGKEEQDNSQSSTRISKTDVLLKFKLIENLNDAVQTLLWSGTETRTTIAAGAGVPGAGTNQTVTANSVTNKIPVPLNLGNDDATVPTLTTVTASGAAGALGVDDDYYLIPIPNSTKWYIYFDEAGTKTVDLSTEDIVIVYGSLDQTASVSFEGGTGTALNDLEMTVALSNDGRPVLFNLYYGELDALGDLTLAADDAEDRRSFREYTYRFRADNTYHSGEVYKKTTDVA